MGRGPDTPPPIYDGEDTPSTGGEITDDEEPELDSDDSNYSCQRHRADCPADTEAKNAGTTRYGLQPGRMYLDATKAAARREHNRKYHQK